MDGKTIGVSCSLFNARPLSTQPYKCSYFYSVTQTDAFTYVNISIAYNVTGHFTFRVDLDKAFNSKAPYTYSAGNDLTKGKNTLTTRAYWAPISA